jgi:hypothetical protein
MRISQVGLKFRDGPVDFEEAGRDRPRSTARLRPTLLFIKTLKELPPADFSVIFKKIALRLTIYKKLARRSCPLFAGTIVGGQSDEAPIGPWSPTSIPQLGVAYQVDSTIVAVSPGSPAR